MSVLEALAIVGAGFAAGTINTIVGLGITDHLSHPAGIRVLARGGRT